MTINTTGMIDQIQTKTVDVNTWNALIFIVTSCITILLGVIAWYQKRNADSQDKLVHEVTEMAKDMAVMKTNGTAIKDDVDEIKGDVANINNKLQDHEKRIWHVEERLKVS